MKTLYFMRHAESEANKKHILASRQDFPLTADGKAEAELISSQLYGEEPIEQIISSPLIRAKQTAQALCERFSLPLSEEPRITEQELGVFSGKTYAELDQCENYVHDRAKRWEWEPEGGGESYQMIAARLQPFFQSIDTLPGESILFVTHAVTMRMIFAILKDSLPIYPEKIAKNGEIWKVEYRGLGQTHEISSLFFGHAYEISSRA